MAGFSGSVGFRMLQWLSGVQAYIYSVKSTVEDKAKVGGRVLLSRIGCQQ